MAARMAKPTLFFYSAGVTYHFRLVVIVGAGTYPVFVAGPDATEQTVASNFCFRTGVPAPTLNNLGADVDTTSNRLVSIFDNEHRHRTELDRLPQRQRTA